MATVVVKSIKAVAGDFPTIAAWEAATKIDLVAADQIQVGELYNENYPETITITGATVDAGHYRWLRAAAGEEHTGKSMTGARMWGFGVSIVMKEKFARLSGVEIYKEAGICLRMVDEVGGLPPEPIAWWDGVLLERLLLHVDDGGPVVQITQNVAGQTMHFRNSVMGAFFGAGEVEMHPVRFIDVTGLQVNSIFLQDLTLVGTRDLPDTTPKGIYASRRDVVSIQNVVVCSCDTCFDGGAGEWKEPTDHNVSQDGTAPGPDSLVNQALSKMAFVSPDTGDFDIRVESVLRDRGVKIPGFSEDFVRRSRVPPWDIGAAEWQVPVGGCWDAALGEMKFDVNANSLSCAIDWGDSSATCGDYEVWRGEEGAEMLIGKGRLVAGAWGIVFHTPLAAGERYVVRMWRTCFNCARSAGAQRVGVAPE